MNFLTHKNQGPNRCPRCFASDNKIVKTNHTYTCLECEFTWTDADSVTAKGMTPENKREGLLGFLRKLGGGK